MDAPSDTDTGDTVANSLPTPPRIALVNTAASFLQNANVARSSIVQKEKFLRSKGLTDEEIQLAFQQAGVFTKDPNNTIINMEIGHRAPVPQPLTLYRPHDTVLQKIYHIVSSTAMVTGFVYAIYYIYKQFIERYLFGRKKVAKTTADLLGELEKKIDKSVRKLTTEVAAVRDEMRAKYSGDHMLRQDMLTFKSDLDAIKGLLLNRKQFARPMVTPSIPAWQLQSQQSIGASAGAHDDDADKHDDNGSGGSSETEVVTKHSDSSLELIS